MPDPYLFLTSSGLYFKSEKTTRLTGEFASLDWLLENLPASELLERLAGAANYLLFPNGGLLRAPIGHQEVWAAGGTFQTKSEMLQRPVLSYKASGPDVVGPEQPVGIRFDSVRSVPEPELVAVLNARLEVVGFTIGNDLAALDIEGESTFYHSQARLYERSCALGPQIWLQPGCSGWPVLEIRMEVERENQVVFRGQVSTGQIQRPLDELVSCLRRIKRFKGGVYLFSGTGIRPPQDFCLAEGDEVRIEIEPIGKLVNPVVTVGQAAAGQPG